MFADKPHRLNGRMRAAISCFDDLASGYRTRVGLPAQRLSRSDFLPWHFSDVSGGTQDVSSLSQSGRRCWHRRRRGFDATAIATGFSLGDAAISDGARQKCRSHRFSYRFC
jgi:hypothetical protein